MPVLVLPDRLEAVAAELQQLAAVEGPQQRGFSTRVLQLVNLVLVHLEEQQQQRQHSTALPPAALQRLAAAARWLCALCVRCRWPALLRQLLPALTAGGDSAAAAVAAMDPLLAPVGLLGMAAAGGSATLLQTLADWAAAAGYRWQLAAGSSVNAITPLHLAAALGPRLSREAAVALLAAVGPAAAAEGWRSARSGGWTPRQVAAAASTAALSEILEPLAAPGPAAAPEPAPAGGAELPASAGGGSSSPDSMARLLAKQRELEDEEGAAAAALPREYLEVELGKKGGSSVGGDERYLPATAAQLEAWQRRPLSPLVLAAAGAAAVLIVVGLSAALRCGLYD